MPSTPFADVRASLAVAAAAGAGGFAWVVVSGGGRWLGVHIFTLGVLTPLVVGFSAHVAATLTRATASQFGTVRLGERGVDNSAPLLRPAVELWDG